MKNLRSRRMIEFGRPVWNSRASTYSISISGANDCKVESEPQFLDVSANSIIVEHPDMNTDIFTNSVKNLLTALIQKDKEAKWFATPLRESSILRRLTHKWNAVESPSYGWFLVSWEPESLEVSSSGFVLTWLANEYKNSTPRISSRFLSLSEPPSPRSHSPESPPIRQITVQANTQDDLEPVYDIPLSTDIQDIDLEEQKRERQVLREARLRVEVAQLKLERNLQNYYRKYGVIPDDLESDSEEEDSLEEED